MGAFDDSPDPDLRDACNRLAAWVEPLPEGVVVDQVSGLTETDLALILRHLHATRLSGATIEDGHKSSRASVPITARD